MVSVHPTVTYYGGHTLTFHTLHTTHSVTDQISSQAISWDSLIRWVKTEVSNRPTHDRRCKCRWRESFLLWLSVSPLPNWFQSTRSNSLALPQLLARGDVTSACSLQLENIALFLFGLISQEDVCPSKHANTSLITHHVPWLHVASLPTTIHVMSYYVVSSISSPMSAHFAEISTRKLL